MESPEATVATLEAMRRQEEAAYLCGDYFYQQQQDVNGITTIGPLSTEAVTNDCREKMVQWCYKVVDFCNFNRETVAIAISILDRFLASRQGNAVLQDRSQFQLAAMTSLYTAVKIHEPEVMSAELVATLSRGTHTQAEIEAMECQLLQALTWLVNPPTTLSFVREYLKLLPRELLDQEMKSTLLEICKFQSELAVADCGLIPVAASDIAYASLMNSLESLCLDRHILGYVSSILSQAANINIFAQELVQVQVRLCHAVAQHTQPQTPVATPAPKAASGGRTATSCGTAHVNATQPRRYKASPCSVTRMEI